MKFLYFFFLSFLSLTYWPYKSIVNYSNLVNNNIKELSYKLHQFKNKVGDKNKKLTRDEILQEIHTIRLVLKKVDPWLRYFEPIEYKKINGPLPIEWEVEAFEKFEKPYKREGAGLFLMEEYLTSNTYEADSLIILSEKAYMALEFYLKDSLQKEIQEEKNFLFVNRLFLLNLAAIYTTGFECPDSKRILPELVVMLEEMQIASQFMVSNKLFLDNGYVEKLNDCLKFIYSFNNNWEKFDHYSFIKNFINPLFERNQKFIRSNKLESIAYNEYSINNSAQTIFDKSLYSAQDMMGVFRPVKDTAILRQIQSMGQKLFFDPLLSGNIKRSCASCHIPSQYFTDTSRNTSLQFDKSQKLNRNTPGLMNVSHQQLMRMDGRHFNFVNQLKDVISNPIELNTSEKEVVKKLLSCKEYKTNFKKLSKYSTEKKLSFRHFSSAISIYLMQYDYQYSLFDSMMLGMVLGSRDAIEGFNIFMGKAQCGTCHFVPGFGGIKPPFLTNEFEVLAVPEDTSYTRISNDKGRFDYFNVGEALNSFRTPTLRNVQFTKPYMHNGVFTSLREVMDFYNEGGGLGRELKVLNQTLPSDKLNLTNGEINKLILFMNSLTENIYITKDMPKLPSSKIQKYNQRTVGGEY